MKGFLNNHEVVRNALALVTSSVISYAASALAVFITARALGAEQYGMYVSCFALTRLTSILFSLGLDNWLLREGGSNRAELGRLMSTALQVKIVVGLLWFVILVLMSTLAGNGLYQPEVLALCAAATWLESLTASLLTGFKSLLANKTTVVTSTVAGALLLGATLTLMFSGEARVSTYIILRLLVALGSACFLIISARKYFVLQRIKIRLTAFFRDVWPYISSEGLFLVYTYADVTIITLMIGQTAAGIYGPATSLISTVHIVPQAVYSVLLPAISRYYAERDARVFSVSRNAIRWAVILGIGLFLVTYLISPLLVLGLLGNEYAPSLPIIRILSANVFLKSISLTVVSILTATGFQKSRLAAQAAAAGLNILLNILVIPSAGLAGAAWVYVFSELVLVAGYLAVLPCVGQRLKSVVYGT